MLKRIAQKEITIISCLFLLALTVRLLYLYESSVNPSFNSPTIDSDTYDQMARSLVDGKEMDSNFFWQPFFYPFFFSSYL